MPLKWTAIWHDVKNAEFHMLHGEIYHTRSTILQIEEQLNSHFIRIHRGCLVSAMAIHDIRNYVELNNGEKLSYTIRKKKRTDRSVP